MDALQLPSKVLIELISEEGSKGSHKLGNGHQTGVERLISRELVLAHLLAPEALAVETHVPAAQVVVDERVYQTYGACRVKILHLCGCILDEGVQARENPAVNLWAFLEWHLSSLSIETIYISIEGEEAVGII